MKSQGIFIAVNHGQCRIARVLGGQVEVRRVEGSASGPGRPIAAPKADQSAACERTLSALGQAVEVLKEWNALGESVCLGLPSEMVFSAQVDTGGLPRKDRLAALTYRLEEQLPLEAERLTADFLPAVAGAALGVAIETAGAKAIVDRLMELGVEVTSICPTALLTLWQALIGQDAQADYALVADEGRVDIFRMAGRCPSAWLETSADPADLVDCLHAELLASPGEVRQPKAMLIGQLASEAESAVRADAGLEITSLGDQPPIELAARAAGQLLSGQQAGWVDLRREALAVPNPWGRLAGLVRCAVILGLAALAATVGSLYWRSLAYDDLARNLEDQQAAQFQRVFPNLRKPPNIHSRLRSELALLSGVSGTGYEMPAQASALDTLRRITDNLPPAIRLRLTDIQLDPGGIVLEGQTRSHSDAELISRTLKQGNFEVDPPRTERLVAGGVAFTIVARLAGGKPGSKPQPAQAGTAATTVDPAKAAPEAPTGSATAPTPQAKPTPAKPTTSSAKGAKTAKVIPTPPSTPAKGAGR